jgi:predicted TIM-barrel fold metal-dependent hydrolase
VTSADATASYRLVDCDVHPYYVDGLEDLADYLTEGWRRRLGIGDGAPTWASHVNGGQLALPGNSFYRMSSSPVRLDTIPADRSVPGSDPSVVARQHLDEYDIDRAILIGGPNSDLGLLPNPDAAAAIAAAYNDWLCDRWLSADERYRGAILVAPVHIEAAVAEVERVADRPGVAGIHMPTSCFAPGDRHFWPLYAAAEHHGLPVLAHLGGLATYRNGPQPTYLPTFYLEGHATATQAAQSGVASLICHGVFARYPKLKYVFVEAGYAWLPDVIWRLERDWKAQRAEVPWVTSRPMDYVLSNIRFTSQPFYEADKPEHVQTMLDAIHADQTLLFSSDYPHWDFDDPRRALRDVPETIRERMFAHTPAETFGDRLA